jgi:DNA-binding NtrC family response regulator
MIRHHVQLEFDGPPRFREIESAYLVQTLSRLGGDERAAATELGIGLETLYNRLDAIEALRERGEAVAS